MLLLFVSPRLNLFIGFQRITILVIPSTTTIVVWPSCLWWWLRGGAICSKDVNTSFNHNFHSFIEKSNSISSFIYYFYIKMNDVSFLHLILISKYYLTAPQYVFDTSQICILESECGISFYFLRYACSQECRSSWIIRTVDKDIFFTIVNMQFSGRNWIQINRIHSYLTFNSEKDEILKTLWKLCGSSRFVIWELLMHLEFKAVQCWFSLWKRLFHWNEE